MSILSIEQQEHSLSKGKKGRFQKISKITMDNPFPEYWPLINSEDTKIVEGYLSRVLVQENKVTLPWKKLSKISKEARKQEILKIKSSIVISTELKAQRQNLVFGLNEVTKGIEKGSLISCLLAGDVDPTIIIKHAVTLAAVHNVPALILNDMKNIIKKHVGFSAIAIGLKHDTLSPDSRHRELSELLKTLSIKYSVPHSLRRLYQTDNVPDSKNNNTNKKVNKEKRKQCQYEVQDEQIDLSKIYCYRTSNSYRAFIPENYDLNNTDFEVNRQQTEEVEENISEDDDKIIDEENTLMYQPLKLKYIRKNVSRKRPLSKKKKIRKISKNKKLVVVPD